MKKDTLLFIIVIAFLLIPISILAPGGAVKPLHSLPTLPQLQPTLIPITPPSENAPPNIEPNNFVLTTNTVDICTDQEKTDWEFASSATLGIVGRDPVGHQIGSFPANRRGVGRNWYPADGFKHILCGKLHHFNFYDGWGDEADWNNFIIPNPEFAHLIADLLPLGTDEWHDCDGQNDCMEAELTPDEHFYHNPWFPKGSGDEGAESFLEGQEICTYGPWVWEEAHGNRPEIHPSELYWWREGNNGPFTLMLLQDDSNRFDRQGNYFGGAGQTWWRPWSEFPRTGEFKIAFEVNPNADPLIFDIRSLAERNIVTQEDGEASRDADDGRLHAIKYNGNFAVFVNERQTLDGNLGVRFDQVCRNEDNTRLQGYLNLTAKTGRGDRGEEGFYVLQVDQRQAVASTERVAVRISSVRREFIPNLNARPDSVIFRANGLDHEVEFQAGAAPQSVQVNTTLSFGDVFPFDAMRISGTAIRGSTFLGDASQFFTEQENFGHGVHVLTISRFMCFDNEPGCHPEMVPLVKVFYEIISEEGRLNLPSPPALPAISLEAKVAVHLRLIEESLRRVNMNGQGQLVADLAVNTVGGPSINQSEYTISSVQVNNQDEVLVLPFIVQDFALAARQHQVTVANLPIPTTAPTSLIVQMTSGQVFEFTVSPFALYPLITNEVVVTAPSNISRSVEFTLPLQTVTDWQVDVLPTYAAMSDGLVSLEDDSAAAETLNEVFNERFSTEDSGRLTTTFGTEQPFQIGWSFQAVNLATTEPVPVIIGGESSPDTVHVTLSQSVIPNGRLKVTFPEQLMDVIELKVTARITDAFGVIGESQYQMWSHIVLKGDSTREVIRDLSQLLVSLTELPMSAFADAVQINVPVADDQTANDPALRHRRILGQMIRRAAQDQLITIDELRTIVNNAR